MSEVAQTAPTAQTDVDVMQTDEWMQEPEELPRRPRRRLLGVGANRVPLALLAVLLTTCGFIGGVLVEKSQSGTSPATGGAGGGAASLASRFRALRGGAGGGSGGGSGFSGGAAGGGFARPTAGTVAYLEGSTLYVTNAEGNTVKVTTSPATSVTKSVGTSVKGIHPGETVTVTGSTGANGAITAESISVGSSGSGGLAALFGGGAGGGRGGGKSRGGGGETSLFGGGG